MLTIVNIKFISNTSKDDKKKVDNIFCLDGILPIEAIKFSS